MTFKSTARSLAALLVSLGVTSTAQAQDQTAPQSPAVVDEYVKLCTTNTLSVDAVKARFIALDWETTDDPDFAFINLPDDLFPDAKAKETYKVLLNNGAYWLGGTGTFSTAGINAAYCIVSFYGSTENRALIMDAFSKVHPETPVKLDGETEIRVVVEASDTDTAAVHQQFTVPDAEDLVLFRIINTFGR